MTTARFDRLELKYLVDDAQRRMITAGLRDCVPDAHGDASGRYPIASVYYDGPDHDVYWDRERGVPSRRKLRVRIYGDSDTAGQPASFLEIKHKYGRRIAKRRAQLSVDDALRAGRGLATVAHVSAAERLVVDETRRMVTAKRLRPTCGVRYVRQAFQGVGANADLRVTFDDALGCRADDLVPRADDSDYPVALLGDGLSVLEIKVDVCAPKWLADLVGSAGVALRPLSKYSMAVEALGLVQLTGAATISITAARRRTTIEAPTGARS